jgi:hypothetical protein
MKTYSILYAEEVPHYTAHEIEAETDEQAIELAKAFNWAELPSDPDYHSAVLRRIVHIEDDGTGENIEESLALDEWFLRCGKEQRRLCDAAPELLKALRAIAEIPLWGEAIEDEAHRADLILENEYDEDGFYPSTGTCEEYFQHAVETARAAIAQLEAAKGKSL